MCEFVQMKMGHFVKLKMYYNDYTFDPFITDSGEKTV